MKLAVFGHYDSRGGTTGMPLPDRPTEADVLAAIRKYDRDLFGVGEPGESIQTTAYGMEARECDKAAHSIIYGDESPGASDFMWVAEIHGDLLDGDLDDGNRHVLIDESNEPAPPGLAEWNERALATTKGLQGEEWIKAYDEFNRRDPKPPELTVTELIKLTLNNPVQLEFVESPEGFDADLKEREDELEEERKRGCSEYTFASDWTEAQTKAADRIRAAEDAIEAERNERIAKMAKVLKGDKVKVRRWDDDAYGFIIGTGM